MKHEACLGSCCRCASGDIARALDAQASGDAAVAVTLQHRGSLGSCEALGSPRMCAAPGHHGQLAHASPALSGAFPGARYRHPLQVNTSVLLV